MTVTQVEIATINPLSSAMVTASDRPSRIDEQSTCSVRVGVSDKS